MSLVAVPAAYGAAGSRIGPTLAQRRVVPLLDRGLPVAVAERLQIPVEDVIAMDAGPSRTGNLLEPLPSACAGAGNATVPPR